MTTLEQLVVALKAAYPGIPSLSAKPDTIRVLVMENGATDRGVLTDDLSRQGFDVQTFASLDDVPDAVREADVIVFYCDQVKISSIEMLSKLFRSDFKASVVLHINAATPALECVAFAVDVIRKSLSSQVPTRRNTAVKPCYRLRKPRSGGPLTCGKLLLRPDVRRAFWNEVDVNLTIGEYNILNLLASNVGRYVSSRALYDRLHHKDFMAGSGDNGYRANVRTLIKRIRKSFRILDPTFDQIETYNGFGYRWKEPR